ncbi:MAG: acyltransferase [Actinobacteria bacterium]|nr:acyltransferase [Actinomycetota bacterium]
MKGSKLGRMVATVIDPGTYAHPIRLLHFYGYSHIRPRRRLTLGQGATIAPNVSLRNGERIFIGARTRIGERAYLWAGDDKGVIRIGEDCRIGPEVFITASDYGLRPDENIADQERNERNVTIGSDVWLGARVFIAAGVTLGDGCVVSAGAVVTRSLPPGCVAVGVPARIVRRREDYAKNGGDEATKDQARAETAE